MSQRISGKPSAWRAALSRAFYTRQTLTVARELLGMHLGRVSNDGAVKSGRIVEVEAYLGPWDRASHARARQRGEVMVPYGRSTLMFGPAGLAYIYIIYGLHHCFNVVAHEEGSVGAVLVRALEPDPQMGALDCRGPGRLCKALGIDRSENGADLCEPADEGLFLIDLNTLVADADVAVTPRIGVDYAGQDAALPYRFCDRRSTFLSRRL